MLACLCEDIDAFGLLAVQHGDGKHVAREGAMQTLDSLLQYGLARIVQRTDGRSDVVLDIAAGRAALRMPENWPDPRELPSTRADEPYFLAEATDAGWALYEPHRFGGQYDPRPA